MYEDKDENRNYEDNEQKLIEARMENMKKEYRKQEYVAVIIINVVFAIFSNLLYVSVREISTIKIYKNVFAAAIGWFLYGGCLCLTLRHEKVEERGCNRSFLRAAIFGVFVAIAKMGLDYVAGWISIAYWGYAKTLVVSGVENGLFGFLITVLLFSVFVRGKVRWSVQSANPIAGIVGLLMLYTLGVNILDGSYYDLEKMISLNVEAFALFMVLLWWLLNTLYDQKENMNIKKSRMINIGIGLGQIMLFVLLANWVYNQKIHLPVYFTYPYEVIIEDNYAYIQAYLSDENEVEIPEQIWWAKVESVDGEIYSNLGTNLIVRDVPEGISVHRLYNQESQSYFTLVCTPEYGLKVYMDKYVGNEKKIEIPKEVWGGRVTSISKGCFQESSVEEVIIPETVKNINSAFQGCESLKWVKLPSQLDLISANAFSGSGLESIELPESVKEIGDGAFQDCKNLKQITLPIKLELIDNYAFGGSGLESIKLPESVKEVGEGAFKYSKIKEVVGFENVEYIGDYAFRGTPWEESIEGDFVCIGDILYLYRGNEEEVIIPSNIKEIRGAFAMEEEYPYPRNVKKVFVSETVTTISEYSFEGQEGLEVYIPETVAFLGADFDSEQPDASIFGADDAKSYENGKSGHKNIIVTTKDSPAIDHAIEAEGARFRIITKEKMQQEKEKAISGSDEKQEVEIMFQPGVKWLAEYIDVVLSDEFVFDEYALLYIDENSIPELVGKNIYACYQIFSCSEGGEAEWYLKMQYGTLGREYFYLPNKNSIICTYTEEDGKGYCEMAYGLIKEPLFTNLNEDYISFYDLSFFSKEEILEKLYELYNINLGKTKAYDKAFEYQNENGNEETKEEIIEEDEVKEEDVEEKKAVVFRNIEGYKYMKQMDLASADGNAYPVMVPRDFSMEEGDRFVIYYDNGFGLSMDIQELGEGETLSGFLNRTSKFIYEDQDRNFEDIEKTEQIEKDGIIYQICTAYGRNSDNTVYPNVEIIVAIPLEGTDILLLKLRSDKYSCSQEGINYLEEIGEYYNIPVTPFIEIEETYVRLSIRRYI